MDEVEAAAVAVVNYSRSNNCPWNWTLQDEEGNEIDDDDPIIFYGDSHEIYIDADYEGEWKYTLCARNIFNDDKSCIDIDLQIN